MEKTLVIFKPSAIDRRLVGRIISRIEDKGFVIAGLKMMQLTEELLREHYAHLVDKPFFPSIVESMTATPVIVGCLAGVEAVRVFREMTGVTNGRNAQPGTLRGDFCMSGQTNIVHASDSVENAKIEIARFFKDEEVFDYLPENVKSFYGDNEL
ncbi:MAG: nucleoside-diphosphate kinase [Muribaculaceae bacterium]|nr:nucleoside-diphosphate kinase [Muribaculaceae bacterium]